MGLGIIIIMIHYFYYDIRCCLVLFCFVLYCLALVYIIFYVYAIYGTYVMLVSFSLFYHLSPFSFGALGLILILDSAQDSAQDSAW